MELKIKDSYFVAGSLWMHNPFEVIEQLCAQESKDGKVTASTLNKFKNDVYKSFGIWLEDGNKSHFLRACETKEDAEYTLKKFNNAIKELRELKHGEIVSLNQLFETISDDEFWYGPEDLDSDGDPKEGAKPRFYDWEGTLNKKYGDKDEKIKREPEVRELNF